MNDSVERYAETREIRPWYAGMLGLLVPGMGQVYTGRLTLAIRWFVVYGVAAIALGILVAPLSFLGGLLWLIAILTIRIAALVEAAVFAARNQSVVRQSYNQARYHFGILIAAQLILLASVQPVRQLGMEAFRIPTGGMENALLVGDYIVVDNRPGYTPQGGDVIVFKFPLNRQLNYVKRCVAVGGQTVEIRERELFVDGQRVMEPPTVIFTRPQPAPEGVRERGIFGPDGAIWNHDHWGPMTVPEGNCLVLGDNRDNSADSRYWGFVPQSDVRGKVAYLYFSFDKHAGRFGAVRWSRIGKKVG